MKKIDPNEFKIGLGRQISPHIRLVIPYQILNPDFSLVTAEKFVDLELADQLKFMMNVLDPQKEYRWRIFHMADMAAYEVQVFAFAKYELKSEPFPSETDS